MNEKLVLNSLTGKMFEPVPIKTYDEVLMDIENWSLNIANGVNGYGVHWSSEYSEWNHEKMTEIVRILDECTHEEVQEMIKIKNHTSKDLWDLINKGYKIQYVVEGREELNKKLLRIRIIGQEIYVIVLSLFNWCYFTCK